MKTKILHIDDDKFLLNMYKIRLETDGDYEVTCVQKLESDFVTQINDLKPDLILTDLVKPLPDGMDILRAVKADERTFEIPFVFLSNTFGPHDEQTFNEANTLGIAGYISKVKTTPGEVVDKINEIVKRLQ